MDNYTLKLLSSVNIEEISLLTHQLNLKRDIKLVKSRLKEMFTFQNYRCFGFYNEGKLIGITSGWITVRIYSGKQLEIDNVIIDSQFHSKGYGKHFMKLIDEWSKENDCETVELNTYVQNSRSHKFYFNQGFEIIGYHFQKKLEE